MKIKYNIAKNKQIDFKKFFLTCAAAFLFSILFISLGVNNLAVQDKRLRTEKDRQEQYRSKLYDMRKKTGEYNEAIRRINSQWRSRVRLANTLIVNKSFDFIGKLDIIEELLPLGVYIKSVSMSVENKSKVQISLVSDAYPRLFEAYKNFSKYDAAILNESVKAGIYNAAVTVVLEPGEKEEAQKKEETKEKGAKDKDAAVKDNEETKNKKEAEDSEAVKDKDTKGEEPKDEEIKDEKFRGREIKDKEIKDEKIKDGGMKEKEEKDSAAGERKLKEKEAKGKLIETKRKKEKEKNEKE